ncbi:MAG: hypothetical protein HQK87_06915, partial [Nitrospinae bacterium]|nr:hypothetical protein [Nitrospinota bacterium]
DAIEAAGGTGWRNAINEYERGMNQVARQKMGAKAMDMLKTPEELISLSKGNRPDIVGDVFGQPAFSFQGEMGAQALPITNVASQLERDLAEQTLGKAGQSKALEIMRMGEKKGVTAPGLIDTKISMTNYALRLLEGKGGKRVNEEMARLMQPENLPELVEVMKAAKPSVRAKLINEMTKHGLKMGGGLTGAILRPDYGQEN